MRGGLNESAGAGVGRWNSWQEQNTSWRGEFFDIGALSHA